MPSYIRFIQGAYACGFVCGDLSSSDTGNMDDYDKALCSPRMIEKWSLQKVRRLVTVMIRAERWNFQVVDEEVGTVRRALDSGLVDQASLRLRALIAEAERQE